MYLNRKKKFIVDEYVHTYCSVRCQVSTISHSWLFYHRPNYCFICFWWTNKLYPIAERIVYPRQTSRSTYEPYANTVSTNIIVKRREYNERETETEKGTGNVWTLRSKELLTTTERKEERKQGYKCLFTISKKILKTHLILIF